MSCPNSNDIYSPVNSPLENHDLYITYDGEGICPTPIVNYTHQPIEFGYVYGYNTDITLDGVITDIKTPEVAREYLISIFGRQFKTLSVSAIQSENVKNELYNWSNITINSISLEQSPYFKDSFIKYQIKCTAYALPSGVIDPSNEFSFTEGEDGTISVTQKISARGVSIENNMEAFENAKAFVQNLTGQKPTYCGTKFLPSNDGILLSVSENINRSEGVYSVTKTYKYNTNNPSPNFVRYTSLDIEDSLGSEYKIANYNLKILGSPIEGELNTLYQELRNFDIKQDIIKDYGFNPISENWVQHTYSANIEEGSKTIDIKAGYLIGANIKGFFDYVVDCEKDELLGTETWKIDGEFKCYGPLSYQRSELENFKSTNKGDDDWKSYLKNLILDSPLYIRIHDYQKLHSENLIINYSEVKEMASLKLSTTLTMGYEPVGTTELKYNINGVPSKWIYEILPSANIEGAYVVQDLQTKTNSSVTFSFSAKTSNKENSLSTINNYLKSISNNYIIEGTPSDVKSFVTENAFMKATFDVSASKKYLGKTNIDETLTKLISVGSYDSSSTRPGGFNFGY